MTSYRDEYKKQIAKRDARFFEEAKVKEIANEQLAIEKDLTVEFVASQPAPIADKTRWQKIRSWRPVWWDEPSDRFAFFAALFTGALAIVAYFQLSAMSNTDTAIHSQLEEMRKAYVPLKDSADAAKKAAEVAEKSLIGVERPILFLLMPQNILIKSTQPIDPTKAKYGIIAENVGKQLAIIVVANATFILQKDSLPPPAKVHGPLDNTGCPIFFIGEITVRPSAQVGFFCQRTDELTAEETKALNDGSIFGFFRVAFVYYDPVGTLRSSISIFLVRPPMSDANFVQISSEDTVLTKATTAEQKEAERKFLGGTIEIQRDMDRRKQTTPPITAPENPNK